MRILHLGNPWTRILARWVISLAFLLTIARLDSYYEQDELAKAAQVVCLAKEPSVLRLPDLPDYYRRDQFSSYYLAATEFYRATGLSAVKAINLFSVLCGATFLAFAPWLIGSLIGASEWLIFAVLWNVPALIVTFCYGNEASFALASITLAAGLLRLESRSALIPAAACFCASAFARTDYVLLFPALALLAVRHSDGALDIRASLTRLLLLSGAALVMGLVYFATVIRKIPDPGFFEYHTNAKLFCAFILYGLGPGVFVGAAIGMARGVFTRRWNLLFFLLLLLQTAPYLTHLTSPKYILPSLVAGAVFSVVGLQWMARGSRWICAVLLVIPWLISASPYGFFAGQKCALWYLPTDAGPIPTGGYLWFYAKVRSGFYQNRYSQELDQLTKAMPILDSSLMGADLVGYSLPGTLRIWSAQHQRWDIPSTNVPFVVSSVAADSWARRKLLQKASFLYELKQSPDLKDQLTSFYMQGRVANLSREDDPFPDVIEVGALVSAGNDVDLGRRIRFVNQRSEGEQWIRRDSFIAEYGGLAWIRSDQYRPHAASYPAPLYEDEAWVCFSENVPQGIYYSLRFPPSYTRNRLRTESHP